MPIKKIKPPRKKWLHRFMQRQQDTLQMERVVGHGWRQRSGPLGNGLRDFVAEASDVDQLCTDCANIKAKLEKVLVRARPSEFRRIHAFEGISASVVKSSCKLCSFILACAESCNWPSEVCTEYLSLGKRSRACFERKQAPIQFDCCR